MKNILAAGLLCLFAVTACDNDDDHANARIAELQAQVADLQDQLAQAQGDDATAQQIASLQSQLDAITAQLNSSADGDTLDELTTEIAALRAQLTTLLEALNAGAGVVALKIGFVFDGQELQLGTNYTTSGGDVVQFSEVRYWLTGLTLVAEDESTFTVPGGYYLMEVRGAQDVDNGTSATITLPAARRELINLSGVPAKTYKGITFNVGVDATYNDNLSKSTGELNILQNMTSSAWMWFTSYIFTKTHGTFGDGASFAWDNGTNADLRNVSVTLPAGVTVASAAPAAINLSADIASVFTGLKPSETATIDASTADARATLANNWATAFAPAAE